MSLFYLALKILILIKGSIVFAELNCGLCPTTFSNTTGLCCQGKFYVNKFTDAECCGSEMLNSVSQICCNGVAYNRTFPRYTICCGDKIYDGEKYHCCDGVIQPRNDKSIACCGTKGYSIQEGLCDKGTVVLFQNLLERSLCGGKLVNPSTTLCCQDKQFPRQNNNQMCCPGFASVYDVRSQICCDGEPKPLTGGVNRCCGKTPYNDARLECSPETGTVVAKSNQYYKYCAGKPISDYQYCCAGKVTNLQGCCGKVAYALNSLTESCCNGQIYNTDSTMKCCYVNETETLYDLKNGRCCSSVGYRAYDSIFVNSVCDGYVNCGRPYHFSFEEDYEKAYVKKRFNIDA